MITVLLKEENSTVVDFVCLFYISLFLYFLIGQASLANAYNNVVIGFQIKHN